MWENEEESLPDRARGPRTPPGESPHEDLHFCFVPYRYETPPVPYPSFSLFGKIITPTSQPSQVETPEDGKPSSAGEPEDEDPTSQPSQEETPEDGNPSPGISKKRPREPEDPTSNLSSSQEGTKDPTSNPSTIQEGT